MYRRGRLKITKNQKNPLKLRNTSKLGIQPISISIPYELLIWLDSVAEPNKRSAYIVRIMKQHRTKISEHDPRYLLKQKQTEYDTWERMMAIHLMNERNNVKQTQVLIEQGHKDYKDALVLLKQKASEKMNELII